PSPFGSRRNTDCSAFRGQVSTRNPEIAAPAKLQRTIGPPAHEHAPRRTRRYRRVRHREKRRHFKRSQSTTRPCRSQSKTSSISLKSSFPIDSFQNAGFFIEVAPYRVSSLRNLNWPFSLRDIQIREQVRHRGDVNLLFEPLRHERQP